MRWSVRRSRGRAWARVPGALLLVAPLLAGPSATAATVPAAARSTDDLIATANVTPLAAADPFTQGLADLQASGSSSLIITSGTDLGYAAIASTYAHRYGVPLLLLPKRASIPRLAKALAAASAKAVIVGGSEAVATSVDAALKRQRIRVVRIAGADRAATAALVATRIKPTAGSPAVYAALSGTPGHIALAAAYANARGLPLLGASRTLSRYTTQAVADLRLAGGVAIGDSRDMTDAVLAQLPEVTRVIGRDLAGTAFVLARSIPAGPPTLVVDDATAPDLPLLIQRARLGEPLLLLDGDPSTPVRAWLTARADLTAIAAGAALLGPRADALGRLLAERGAVGALPALPLQPMPAASVPAAFTFSGSGFGHGVGMSQWGAYGMAKESHTATEILEHYFTGSLVAPIKDNLDLNVSLDSRVSSQSFRLEKLADAASTLELSTAEGQVFLLGIGDVVKATYSAGAVAVTVSGNTTVPALSTTALTLKWAGNRDSGTATGGPAVLRVAGPGLSISSGQRYRYGIVSVTPSKVSGGLALGLQVNNILRLHDEYLYGIAEVGSSWPEATLQAQVITARSYAYRKARAGLRSACACHVYDDPRDQNFTGYAKLAEKVGSTDYGARWKAAVDSTLVSAAQGQALTVDGNVVSAYYSAATGGMTQNNEDVWGGSPLSYTRSVDDQWSLRYASSSVTRWVPRSFSQATVAAAFGAPDVVWLDLSDRYPSGAVNNLVAWSSNGQRYVLGAETFKSRLNRGLADALVLSRGIPSVWMWRVDTEVPLSSAAAAAMQVSAGTTSIAAQLPAATATTVVITQAPNDTATIATLALAAAHAGRLRAGLLVNASRSGLDASIRNELSRRKATQVVVVGTLPAAALSALATLKLPVQQVTATTLAALSASLAVAGGIPPGTPVVVAASTDTASAALAVSLSARLARPLLVIDGGVLSGEVSALLMATQPAGVLVVGSADAVPDAAVAGFGEVQRLTTGDPTLAAVIAASQRYDSATVGAVLAGVAAPLPSLLAAAASGLPLYLVREAVPEEVRALAQRAPALTLLLRVGVDPLLLESLRRA